MRGNSIIRFGMFIMSLDGVWKKYCNKIGVMGLWEWVLGNVDGDIEEGVGGGWYRFLKGVFEFGDDEKVVNGDGVLWLEIWM